MFCANCGHLNSDDGLNCMQCGQSLQNIPAAQNIAGQPDSILPAQAMTQIPTSTRTEHKRRTGLFIALAVGGLAVIAALLSLFLWIIPSLNKDANDRLDDTTTGDFSIVGLWASEDIPAVLKFKDNNDVILYTQSDKFRGTYEYNEDNEEGIISLASDDIKFQRSDNGIDLESIGEFKNVDDDDFYIQEFIDENRTGPNTSDITSDSLLLSLPGDDDINIIGIAMPTKSLQRWNEDGVNMKKQLEAAGYTVDIQYANDDVATQIDQVENMIAGGCDVLVIAAIDGSALGPTIDRAKSANIPVIAYDRLITNSDGVSYYATFDNFRVGVIQGLYIANSLDLQNAQGPFTMEIFAGDINDNNAKRFYDGAMSVLQSYIDSGKLIIVSGQTSFEAVATAGWKTENAQIRMDNLITTYYANGTLLNAVLCSNDSTALGVETSLGNAGTFTVGVNWPIITGQDCDKQNVINMIAGKQSMSVFKDTRTQVSKVVEMVTAILENKEVPVNDTVSFDNGTIIVPTFLCEPVYLEKDSCKQYLIDSGYYREEDLIG